jgi:hypothetical protein
MADILNWNLARPRPDRQPSIEELLEEAEALLAMQQAALRDCRSPETTPESETRLIIVANTLNHLRTHLGRIRTMIAGG